MSSNIALQHLKFSYDSLYGSLLLGPSVAVSLSEIVEVGGVVAIAGLVSNLVSYKVAKISIEKGWSDNQTRGAIFFSSLSIFAVSACAVAILGMGGAISCIIAGAGISLLNMIFFEGKIDDARRMDQNHLNWKKAHKEIKKYIESFAEYAKLVSFKTAAKPDDLLKSSFNKPERGTLFLSMINEEQEKLDKAIVAAKNSQIVHKIRDDMDRYACMYEQLSDEQTAGLISATDLYSECAKEGLYSNKHESIVKVEAFVDENLSKILAKYKELKLEPAA